MEKGDITSTQIVGIVIAVLVIVLAVMVLMNGSGAASSATISEATLRSECMNWQRFGYATEDGKPGTFNKDNYSNLWKKFVPVKLDADKKPIDPAAADITSGTLSAKAYCTWQMVPDCSATDACGTGGCTDPAKCQPKSDNSGCECGK